MQRLPATLSGGSPGTSNSMPADQTRAALDHSPDSGDSPDSEETLDSAQVVNDIADLVTIFKPHINILVLRQSLSHDLEHDAREALGAIRRERRATITLDASGRSEVRDLLPGSPHLAEDIYHWADVLAELTGCELVGIRIARLEKAMCPRFHVDNVTLRLVRTYDGLGTEYLAHDDVDRRWLGPAARGKADDKSGLFRSPDCVRAATTGDVVLLKGSAWPDNKHRGAVHRSPHASPSEPRLVVTLDPLDWD